MTEPNQATNQLEKIRTFFERNTKKNPKCFYRLYVAKNKGMQPHKKFLRADNFESEDIDDSLVLLEKDILVHGENSPPYMILKHLSSSTDPNPSIYIFQNPLYSDVGNSNFPTIAGMKMGSNGNLGVYERMLSMQNDSMDKQAKLQRELMEEKHDRHIEAMTNAIEGIKESQKNIGDTIKGVLDSEVGKMFSQALIGIMTAKMVTPQQQQAYVQPNLQQQQKVSPIQVNSNEGQQKQDKMPVSEQSSLNNSITQMQTVFGKDFIKAMQNLSTYCSQNPDAANALFNNVQSKPNEG